MKKNILIISSAVIFFSLSVYARKDVQCDSGQTLTPTPNAQGTSSQPAPTPGPTITATPAPAQPTQHFERLLVLGKGSGEVGIGVKRYEDICRQANGRFDAIVIWGHPQGFVNNNARDIVQGVTDLAFGKTKLPNITADSVVYYSGGTGFEITNKNVYYLDTNGKVNQEKLIPGVVSSLTAMGLEPLSSGVIRIISEGMGESVIKGDSKKMDGFKKVCWGISEVSREGFAQHRNLPVLIDKLNIKIGLTYVEDKYTEVTIISPRVNRIDTVYNKGKDGEGKYIWEIDIKTDSSAPTPTPTEDRLDGIIPQTIPDAQGNSLIANTNDTTPFDSGSSDKLGGIDFSLKRIIDAMDNIDGLFTGFEIDNNNGMLTFLVDADSQTKHTHLPRHEMFYTALRLMHTYGDISKIAFSLDPTSRKEWDEMFANVLNKIQSMDYSGENYWYLLKDIHPPQKPRYIGAPIEGTVLGEIALYSDLALKSIFIGFDYRTGERLFLSQEHERLISNFVISSAGNAMVLGRFWFILDRAKVYEKNGRVEIDVNIKAKFMNMDWMGGSLADTGNISPQAQDLADYISRHLDEIKEHFPIIRDLEEMYRMLILLEVLNLRGIYIPDNSLVQLNNYSKPKVVQGMAVIHAPFSVRGVGAIVGGIDFFIPQRLYFVTDDQWQPSPSLHKAFSIQIPRTGILRSRMYNKYQLGNLDETIAACKEVLRENKADIYALSTMAQAYLDKEKFNEAIAQAQQTLQYAQTMEIIPGKNKTAFLRDTENIITKAKLKIAIQQRKKRNIIFALISIVFIIPAGIFWFFHIRANQDRTKIFQETSPGIPLPVEKSNQCPAQLELGPDGIFRPKNTQ